MSRIQLPTGTEAEVARPSQGESTRGVVLFPDIGGLRPLFDDLCAHLADTYQWTVCAPEAWSGREALTVPERLERAGELDDDVVLGDALAAAEATGCDHVAVIGFCMGGMFALKASGIWRFDRIAAFYGMVRLPEHWRSATLGEPLPVVESLGLEAAGERLLAVVGTEDPWVPSADADALEAAGATVVRYQGANHGFVHDASRPDHRPADAADAWHRVVTFFNT
jgi:carboxymethylenebutenolidase